MSYDVWFVIDTGATEPTSIDDPELAGGLNYTSNVGPMFRDAMVGGGLPSLDGVKCADAAQTLKDAITRMEYAPDRYRAMNPANGWGDYDSALDFLRAIHAWCERHPKATVRVSW